VRLLRRTCATLLVTEHGLPPNQVQTWLGHEDPHITLALYTQLTSDDLPRVEWGQGVGHEWVTAAAEPGAGAYERAAFQVFSISCGAGTRTPTT
jgi:hypothetical protein